MTRDPIPLVDVVVERVPPGGQFVSVSIPITEAVTGRMIPGIGRIVSIPNSIEMNRSALGDPTPIQVTEQTARGAVVSAFTGPTKNRMGGETISVRFSDRPAITEVSSAEYPQGDCKTCGPSALRATLTFFAATAVLLGIAWVVIKIADR